MFPQALSWVMIVSVGYLELEIRPVIKKNQFLTMFGVWRASPCNSVEISSKNLRRQVTNEYCRKARPIECAEIDSVAKHQPGAWDMNKLKAGERQSYFLCLLCGHSRAQGLQESRFSNSFIHKSQGHFSMFIFITLDIQFTLTYDNYTLNYW